MTSLAVSGRLQNVIKYCTEVCKTRPPSQSRIIRPLFNLESPNFARTSMPTENKAALNMTSPATSGQHLSKLQNTAENAASDGFRSNFFRIVQAGYHKIVHAYEG